MNTLKLITLPIMILISFMLLLFIIHYLLRPLKAKIDEEGNLKISYGIWFGALFLSGCSIIKSIILIALEAIDNINKIQPRALLYEITKTLSSIIAIAFIWLLIWYFIVKFTIKTIYKINDEFELENNNSTYFLIKGIAFTGIVFCLSSILELLLKMTVPSISIPFYH